eukprot:2070907-Prymnesium_polylepis.1
MYLTGVVVLEGEVSSALFAETVGKGSSRERVPSPREAHADRGNEGQHTGAAFGTARDFSKVE